MAMKRPLNEYIMVAQTAWVAGQADNKVLYNSNYIIGNNWEVLSAVVIYGL